MARHIRGRFASDILRGIPGCAPEDEPNYNVTRRRLVAALAWMRAESGNLINDGVYPTGGAAFNPLGSTYPYNFPEYFPPGSGKPGVRNFPSFEEGIANTLETLFLTGHHYEGIIAAFQSGHSVAVGKAIALSDWGTGAGVSKSLILYTSFHYRTEFERPVSEWMP